MRMSILPKVAPVVEGLQIAGSSIATKEVGGDFFDYLVSGDGLIQLHVDTPDTPNWYIKHHQGLEYLNLAMAQVTDNPAMADGSSLHQEAKQQLHQYLHTYIQPLMRAGKQASLQDILLQVNSRRPQLVQQLGKQLVQHMAQMLLDQ